MSMVSSNVAVLQTSAGGVDQKSKSDRQKQKRRRRNKKKTQQKSNSDAKTQDNTNTAQTKMEERTTSANEQRSLDQFKVLMGMIKKIFAKLSAFDEEYQDIWNDYGHMLSYCGVTRKVRTEQRNNIIQSFDESTWTMENVFNEAKKNENTDLSYLYDAGIVQWAQEMTDTVCANYEFWSYICPKFAKYCDKYNSVIDREKKLQGRYDELKRKYDMSMSDREKEVMKKFDEKEAVYVKEYAEIKKENDELKEKISEMEAELQNYKHSLFPITETENRFRVF
jgi:hypothetical protein